MGASSGGIIQYGVGTVLLGLATGLLLVIALPPVVRQFPPKRLPITASLLHSARRQRGPRPASPLAVR